MLNISINLETGIAKLAQASAIKAGGGVPVRITFSSNPGTDPVIELALSPQSSSPSVLAYLDTFDAQSSTVYTGTLEANDSRLIAHLTGKSAQTLDVEVVVTVGEAERQIFPNFPVTVQPPTIAGPESSEGGPVYLNETQSDARYLRGAFPSWLANGADDAGSFYPEGAGGSVNGTTDLYINDQAASGGTGWNSYFLTRIGAPPFVLNLTDRLGHVSTFSVESIADDGGGYVHLAVNFRNGYEGDWSGVYQFSIVPAISSVPFYTGNLSGNYAPDLSNGTYQICYQVVGDLTIQEPLFNEGTYRQAVKSLFFELQWNDDGGYLLNFDSNIQMPPAARAVLPVTLEAYRSYLIELRVIGGYWCLISVTGPNVEIVD